MQMGKKIARAGFVFIVVCTALILALGVSLSTLSAETGIVEPKLPASTCISLGDKLISNQFIESAAVVGLAGTALTLFSKPDSQRSLDANCSLK